jgi:hypothetical protein
VVQMELGMEIPVTEYKLDLPARLFSLGRNNYQNLIGV